jgi:hypothetical protein
MHGTIRLDGELGDGVSLKDLLRRTYRSTIALGSQRRNLLRIRGCDGRPEFLKSLKSTLRLREVRLRWNIAKAGSQKGANACRGDRTRRCYQKAAPRDSAHSWNTPPITLLIASI